MLNLPLSGRALAVRARVGVVALGVVGVFGLPAMGAGPVQTVFYLELENHNWTQPQPLATGSTSSGFAQLKDDPASGYVSPATYLNSLISTNPAVNPVYGQVSYASAYHSVLSTPTGTPTSIHPSEPNYI